MLGIKGSKLCGKISSIGSSAGSCVAVGAGFCVAVGAGFSVGTAVGFVVGAAVGFAVGSGVGFVVGTAVGFTVGSGVGFVVGAAVGVAGIGLGDDSFAFSLLHADRERIIKRVSSSTINLCFMSYSSKMPSTFS